LQGITPLALTQSGSEAYLAIERIQGYNLTWKRIATGFMYQEDGGSGRLSSSGPSRWKARLNSRFKKQSVPGNEMAKSETPIGTFVGSPFRESDSILKR